MPYFQDSNCLIIYACSLFVKLKSAAMPADKLGPKSSPSRRGVPAILQRIMVTQGLTADDVVRRSGVDKQTVRQLLRDDDMRPAMRTLQQLAEGLGIELRELIPSSPASRRRFDRRTNPIVDEVIAKHPHWFDGWMPDDFDDLYSRFGTGGALTWDGVVASVRTINLRREMSTKVALLLETGESDVLVGMINLMYGKVILSDGESLRSADTSRRAGIPRAEDRTLHLHDAPSPAVGFGD
jgi:transcriptional regulator with XRE-family HTH domain